MSNSTAAFVERISFRPRFASVATLGDEPTGLTCSVIAGRRWAPGNAAAVLGYPSFELAAAAVRTGEHDALLVPAAYPEIRNFFFDAALKAVETFLDRLPDMVLALPAGTPGGRHLDVVYHHPATVNLVRQLPYDVAAARHASSNSAACRDALAHTGGSAAAVTNQTSADHYGLRTVDVLAAGTAMGFVVFVRKDHLDDRA
jgi:hypothetical protein